MKIEDYILKHNLEPWKQWIDLRNIKEGAVHVSFVTTENGETFPLTDELQIYTNCDRTRFVIINATRNIFRIHHHELVPCSTGWHDCDRDYTLQKFSD